MNSAGLGPDKARLCARWGFRGSPAASANFRLGRHQPLDKRLVHRCQRYGGAMTALDDAERPWHAHGAQYMAGGMRGEGAAPTLLSPSRLGRVRGDETRSGDRLVGRRPSRGLSEDRRVEIRRLDQGTVVAARAGRISMGPGDLARNVANTTGWTVRPRFGGGG
jgi:hypothetical protein